MPYADVLDEMASRRDATSPPRGARRVVRRAGHRFHRDCDHRRRAHHPLTQRSDAAPMGPRRRQLLPTSCHCPRAHRPRRQDPQPDAGAVGVRPLDRSPGRRTRSPWIVLRPPGCPTSAWTPAGTDSELGAPDSLDGDLIVMTDLATGSLFSGAAARHSAPSTSTGRRSSPPPCPPSSRPMRNLGHRHLTRTDCVNGVNADHSRHPNCASLAGPPLERGSPKQWEDSRASHPSSPTTRRHTARCVGQRSKS